MHDSGLYQRILGDEWRHLDAAIQRMHTAGQGIHSKGLFRVIHGRHRVARLLARLLRLPAEGENAEARLHVEPAGSVELWRRTFNGRPLVTRQSSAAPGVLAEQLGRLEFQFRLSVRDRALIYQQSRAGLRIGSRLTPLPAWMAPAVAASEKPSARAGCVSISVNVSLPRIGLLLSYAGEVETLENER
jgi:hypothetical protein